MDVMDGEMQPIGGMFISELTKDPGDIDYKMIGDRSRRTARYFGLFHDKKNPLFERYEGDKNEHRADATKARAWLLEIAAAADRKEQATLVRLVGRHEKMCSLCHVFLGG